MFLSICVCTCRRPEGLRRTLASLLASRLPTLGECEILVVDNDPAGSAAAAFSEFSAGRYEVSLRYVHEPSPGVSHARNRCLAETDGEWMAFIDDDEAASPNWLEAMLACAERFDADAVFGPVLPLYSTTPEPWLLQSKAHERPRFPTGTRIPWGDARSGNVLLSRRLANAVPPFDVRFARTGGEDSLYFGRALAAGMKLVWCDEAEVQEWVPAWRMSRAWVLRRAFLGGRTFVRLQATLGSNWAYLRWAAHGGISCLVLALPALFAAIFRTKGSFILLRKLAGASGKLVAPFYGGGDYG